MASPELDEYAIAKGIGYWSCKLSFYGAAKANAANWEFAKEKFSAIPGVKFEDGRRVQAPADSRAARKSAQAAVRHTQPGDVLHRRAFGDEPDAHEWPHVVLADHSAHGRGDLRSESSVCGGRQGIWLADPQLQPAVVLLGARVHFYFRLPGYRDVETNKKNRVAFKKLIQVAADHGWGEYRTPPAFQDAIMNTYSFNNHALLRFHETIKDAVDPNGILSAGRYGIWPKHMRETKT